MSKMLWVAGGLAVTLAMVFGIIYAVPESSQAPAAGGGPAVAFDKALADKGKQIASSNGCTSCHTTDGGKGAGPTWGGDFGTQADIGGKKVPVDAAFIRTAIVDPNAQVRSGFGPSMPSYKGKLSDADIDAVVEYMKSLTG